MTHGAATGTDEVLTEIRGQVGCITLNRPKALNALSLPMIRALTRTLLSWRDNPGVKAVAVRGSNRHGVFGAFCAGGDIRFFHQAALAGDAALRQSFNDRLERWVEGLAPDVSAFIAQHIEDTVRRWDTEEMTQLIELNIGKDLQYIRINGTVVGGLIGLVLFAVSHVGEMGRALWGG